MDFPRVEQAAAPPRKSPIPGLLPRGTETVLIVEDEEGVRKLMKQMLSRNGYTVLSAEKAESALRLLDQHPGPVQLLITDVVLPGMGGREIARRAAIARPDIRIVFMSGYSDRGSSEMGGLVPGIAFLQKPFSSDVLARNVRDVLDDPVP